MDSQQKQEQKTTPDATATPRTDAEAKNWAPPVAVRVAFARAERAEAELATAKAMLCDIKDRVAADEDFSADEIVEFIGQYVGKLSQGPTWAMNAAHKETLAESAQLRAECRERTQWQCKCGGTDCAGMAENERLRAEVERLKAADSFSKWELARGNEIIDGLRQERDQLRARVGELGADKARLAVARGFIKEYLALGGLFNPEAMEHNKVRDLLMDIADIIDGNRLSPNGLVAKRQAAIDAARAGKEAT